MVQGGGKTCTSIHEMVQGSGKPLQACDEIAAAPSKTSSCAPAPLAVGPVVVPRTQHRPRVAVVPAGGRLMPLAYSAVTPIQQANPGRAAR